MNQYGALTLLKNLDIKELQFKTKINDNGVISSNSTLHSKCRSESK